MPLAQLNENPKTGAALDAGKEGELVLTTLTKESLPLIRYRTGDAASPDFGPRDCGRTLARVSRIHSRTDDTAIVQGVSVFPAQIEAVLAEIEGRKPHFRMVIERQGAANDVEIQVEASGRIFDDTVGKPGQVEDRVAEGIRRHLGILARIRLVEPRMLDQLIPPRAGYVVVDKRDS